MKEWAVGAVSIGVALAIALAIAWAGGQQGVQLGGWSVLALCGVFAFAVQWLMFLHAWLTRSELYFDITGSVTYVVMVLSALWLSGANDLRSYTLALLIAVWALRLGPFLFARIKQTGEDRRFRSIRNSFPTFLMTWTLQGTWVFLTAGAALAAITSERVVPAGAFYAAGLLLWLFGFAFEVVADRQKSAFRAEPANAGRFIDSGLWAWCRHPNYFGEIVLWAGIALISLPVLQGWQLLTLISPLFVYVLLRYISGIRMLDNRARRLWGQDPEYQAYRRNTPMLWPRSPKLAQQQTGSG